MMIMFMYIAAQRNYTIPSTPALATQSAGWVFEHTCINNAFNHRKPILINADNVYVPSIMPWIIQSKVCNTAQ